MTVSYCFFIKTEVKEDVILEKLESLCLEEYDASVFLDGDTVVAEINYCYDDLAREYDMVKNAMTFLRGVSLNKQLLYSRCNDPYYLDSEIIPINEELIFKREYSPAYCDGEQYLYKLEE